MFVSPQADTLFARTREEITELYPFPMLPTHFLDRDPANKEAKYGNFLEFLTLKPAFWLFAFFWLCSNFSGPVPSFFSWDLGFCEVHSPRQPGPAFSKTHLAVGPSAGHLELLGLALRGPVACCQAPGPRGRGSGGRVGEAGGSDRQRESCEKRGMVG